LLIQILYIYKLKVKLRGSRRYGWQNLAEYGWQNLAEYGWQNLAEYG